MGLFSNLGTEGLEESQDRIGGNRAINSDIYTGVVKALYAGKSDSGANSVTILLALPGGQEYSETYWITNKKGENWFPNKQDPSKKVALPGFTIVEEICLVTTDKSLSEQEWEEKTINVYDFDAKKEQPKAVMMATDIIGKEVTLGILKELGNKKEKINNEYVATAETQERNVTDKVFHTDTKKTVPELRNEVAEPEFYNKWLERNKDTTRDKREIKDGQAKGVKSGPPKAGASTTTTTASPARQSLFGKK